MSNSHPQPEYRPHMPTPDQYLDSLQQKPGQVPKQPHRIRKLLKRIFIVLLFFGLAIGAYIIFNLLRLSVNPFDFGKLKGEATGRVNILVLGVGDPGHAGQNLSDTTMLVSINTNTKQAAMISLPRDLRVRIPGYGSAKINQAHAIGGVDTAKEVVENTLDIEIHYFAKANFTGLREAVDAVGGVEIDVKERLYDPEYPCDNNQYKICGMVIKKGKQHMDGRTALKYARCRKGNCGDDFGRALRQQEILAAVRQKALSLATLANPARLNQLSAALGDNIKTDLSINNVLRLGKIMGEINEPPIQVVFNPEPGGFLVSASGDSDLLPVDGSFHEMAEFVRDIFKLGPIWVEKPTLVIENGTGTVGLGAKLKDQIEEDGYRITVVSLANAIKRDHAASQIIDYSGGKKPKTVAYLEGLLGVKVIPPPAPVKNPVSDLRVILGSDYVAKIGSDSEQSL